jgi:hypothetical protein
MAHQLRLRFPKREKRVRSSEPQQAWVIVHGRPPMPYGVIQLDDDGRPNLRPGIVYTDSLEAARRYMPADALAVTGFEAARLVKALPASLGEVLEVWF